LNQEKEAEQLEVREYKLGMGSDGMFYSC